MSILDVGKFFAEQAGDIFGGGSEKIKVTKKKKIEMNEFIKDDFDEDGALFK